jgi:hypothetical protein
VPKDWPDEEGLMTPPDKALPVLRSPDQIGTEGEQAISIDSIGMPESDR